MRLHVEALFTSDAARRLVSVNETGGGTAPRCFFGRTADGVLCRVRHDVPDEVGAALHALAASVPATGVVPDGPDPELRDRCVEILGRHAPAERIWTGPAWHFPQRIVGGGAAVVVAPHNAGLLEPHFSDWLPDVDEGLPFAAVLEGGTAASICCSVRVTNDAHEAGVETHSEFRGRGHAGVAVAAWARMVREAGAEPLYSTSWENHASRGVAAKLGLVPIGADLHAR